MERGAPRRVPTKCYVALMPVAGGWHHRAEEEGLLLLHPVERDPPASLSPAGIAPYSTPASTPVAPLQIT